MSYYSKKYNNDDTSLIPGLISIAIGLGLFFLIMIGVNSCSADTWNNGICPNCEVRYELRGASNGIKYYSCPDCGQEVQRY